jgi:[ribosomal protein S5]-alanine N-acetyltransferase
MLAINYSPFPSLESNRLVFRQLQASDAKDVLLLRSNALQMQYIPRPLLQNITQAQEMILMMNEKINQNTDINWAVCEKHTQRFIGFMGFYKTQAEHHTSEMGYMVLPQFEGLGYVTEAVSTLLNFAFNLIGFHSIEAIIDPNNKASERVLLKNNFTKEAHFRENICFNNQFLDSVHYRILKQEY